MVLGWAVKSAGSTMNLVLSTINVSFSSEVFVDVDEFAAACAIIWFLADPTRECWEKRDLEKF